MLSPADGVPLPEKSPIDPGLSPDGGEPGDPEVTDETTCPSGPRRSELFRAATTLFASPPSILGTPEAAAPTSFSEFCKPFSAAPRAFSRVEPTAFSRPETSCLTSPTTPGTPLVTFRTCLTRSPPAFPPVVGSWSSSRPAGSLDVEASPSGPRPDVTGSLAAEFALES